MNRLLFPAIIFVQTSVALAVDFQKDLSPLFKTYCYKCHSESAGKEKGKLVLDNVTRLTAKIDGKVITAGSPDKSSLFKSMALPKDDDDHMPPTKEKQPTAAEVALVKQWITEGAKLEGGGAAPAPAAAPPAPPAPAATPPAPAADGGVLTWSNTEGKTIKATQLRVEGENVVLQRDDGVCFTLPISKLSPGSQAQVKK